MTTDAIHALLSGFAERHDMGLDKDGATFKLSLGSFGLACDRAPEGEGSSTDMVFNKAVTVYVGPRRYGTDTETIVVISAMASLSHRECVQRKPQAHYTKTLFHNFFVIARGKFPDDACRLNEWLEVARTLAQAMTKADLIPDTGWSPRRDYDKYHSPMFCTVEDPPPLSEEKRLPTHWRTGVFPSMGDVWLVRFKDGDICVCRVSSSDDLGGNLVELSLQCLRWKDGGTFDKSYDFYHEGSQEHDIVSWSKADAHVNSEEWVRFVEYCGRSSTPAELEPAKIKSFVEAVVHSEVVCQKVVIPAAVYVS